MKKIKEQFIVQEWYNRKWSTIEDPHDSMKGALSFIKKIKSRDKRTGIDDTGPFRIIERVKTTTERVIYDEK